MNLTQPSRRAFLKTMGASVSALAASCSVGCFEGLGENERPPNIVIIFTDDQGYADVGVYGAKGFSTPHLDKMSAEGIRFSNFYVSQAVCSASRASLLTGCYSERVGIQGALMPWSKIGLNPKEETLADLLKKKGYATGIFGKWHLGHHKKFLPLQQGFDEYLGLPYSNDMWPVGYDGKPNVQSKKRFYPPLALIDGNEKTDEIRTLEDQGTLTTRYTERAVKFIDKNKDRPFFLYMPHSMPHVPLGVSDAYRGKSEQGMYGDVIMEIDGSVGEIQRALNKYGLAENTLIIFASDNGPWLNYGNHAGSAKPLREGKGSMWEGGARVPCIMRWHGRIPAGSVNHDIAATIDILPTVAAITGATLPKKKIDGVNILSLLEGKNTAPPRDHYFYYYGGKLQAVRKGKWKLHFPHAYRSYQGVEPGKDGFPGPYAKGKTGLELYDLEADISETRDLAAQYPDIVGELQALADQARKELGDRLTHIQGKEVREPGRLNESKKKKINHLATGKKVSLKTDYSTRYPGGGDHGLINGYRGSDDYMDSAWQGYEASDLEATIDLGESKSIRRVTCGFLRDQMVWVFLPASIEIAVSQDGDNFTSIKKFKENTKPKPESKVKNYVAEFPPCAARYIRVNAINGKTCPDWHPGAGGRSWIFSDEIVVE